MNNIEKEDNPTLMLYGLKTDNSIEGELQDSLGFKEYSNVFAHIINTKISDLPITIGIFGGWGSGKTSLMKLIQNKINNRYKTIWFDAWKFDKDEDVRRALIQHIVNKLEEDIKEIEKKFKEEEPFKLFNGYVTEIGKDIAYLAARSSVLYLSKGSVDINNARKYVKKKKKKVYKKALEGIEGLKDINLEEYKKMVSEIMKINITFEKLVTEYLKIVNEKSNGNKRNNKIVFFIDDVDRCLPDRAIDVLNSLKLFLDSKNCIFIIGIDDKMIDSAFNERYGNHYMEEKSYLDKIVQVSFRIPALTLKYVDKTLGKHFKGHVMLGGEGMNLFINSYFDTIRKIKKFANNFAVSYSIYYESTGTPPNHALLAKIIAIRMLRKDYFERIISDPTSLTIPESQLEQRSDVPYAGLSSWINGKINHKDTTIYEKEYWKYFLPNDKLDRVLVNLIRKGEHFSQVEILNTYLKITPFIKK